MIRTATCCCGQASIEVENDPQVHVACHCDNCKKRTGSAFGLSAYFADSQVKSKNGDTHLYEINTDKTQQERHFCSVCGTTLYWKISRFTGMPDLSPMTGIAGGCFIDDPLPEPTISSAHKQKCAWVGLPELEMFDLPE